MLRWYFVLIYDRNLSLTIFSTKAYVRNVKKFLFFLSKKPKFDFHISRFVSTGLPSFIFRSIPEMSSRSSGVGRNETSTTQRAQCRVGIAAHALCDEQSLRVRGFPGAVHQSGRYSSKFSKMYPDRSSEERACRYTSRDVAQVRARTPLFFNFFPPSREWTCTSCARRWTGSGIWATPNRCGRSMEIKHQWVLDEFCVARDYYHGVFVRLR